MIVGIDFDNTLVCYDGLFHAEAVKRDLIPANTPTHKQGVRDMLRALGQEEAWTELQGHIYGPGLAKAAPYPGTMESIDRLVRNGARVCIVSHKTPFPYLGPRYDLHAAARIWLHEQGFHAHKRIPESDVYLEPTMAQKHERIGLLGCTHFVDDLPEFLTDIRFPVRTQPILFVPEAPRVATTPASRLKFCASWQEITMHLIGPVECKG